MTTNFARRLAFAITLFAAAAGSQAAESSHVGARDPFTDGARSVSGALDPYTDGARSVHGPRSPYYDGAHTAAGKEPGGLSAAPARNVEPYLDGTRA